MTPSEVTNILRQFNAWRRCDEGIPHPGPLEVGAAIDAAVEMIERMEKHLLLILEEPENTMSNARNAKAGTPCVGGIEMIDIKELRRLAQAATPGPWSGCGPSFGESLPKYLNEVVVDREGDEDDCYSICNAPIGLDEEHSADMTFIAAVNPATISELLDRLEAAEKELESWKGLAQQFGNEADELRAAVRHEADCVEACKAEVETLRARIEEMEKQEPAAWTTKLALTRGNSTLGFDACRGNLWGEKGVPLYALPGAKGEEK